MISAPPLKMALFSSKLHPPQLHHVPLPLISALRNTQRSEGGASEARGAAEHQHHVAGTLRHWQ